MGSDDEWVLVVPLLHSAGRGRGAAGLTAARGVQRSAIHREDGDGVALDAERSAALRDVYQQAQHWLRAGCFEALAEDLCCLLRLPPAGRGAPAAVWTTPGRFSALHGRTEKQVQGLVCELPESPGKRPRQRPCAHFACTCTGRATDQPPSKTKVSSRTSPLRRSRFKGPTKRCRWCVSRATSSPGAMEMLRSTIEGRALFAEAACGWGWLPWNRNSPGSP